MANDVTSPKLWTLTDVGVIIAKSITVKVRRVLFYPSTIDHTVLVQEYGADGTLIQAIKIKANHTDVNPVSIPFNPPLELNGFKLTTIDGGSVDVYREI
jgi:hypothetical protein